MLGVKGPSILSTLPAFNIVECLMFDSLHAIDYGAVRQLFSLWFDSQHHDQPWYIGESNLKDKINDFLMKIQPTSNITRLPRSVNEKAFWKAAKFRNFLLHYGPFILNGMLPPRFYKNFLLLSEFSYLMNQTKITQMEIFQANCKVPQFVKDFQTLYGLERKSFNLHITGRHACDSVGRWGPFWAYTTYGFENSIGAFSYLFAFSI